MDTEEISALQKRVKDLESILRQNDKFIVITFRLPPVLANVLGLLLAQPLVTPEAIEDRLGVRDAKAAIHRLRRKIHKHDITISAGRHIGYWLEPEEKAKIDLLITARVTEDRARQGAALETAPVP